MGMQGGCGQCLGSGVGLTPSSPSSCHPVFWGGSSLGEKPHSMEGVHQQRLGGGPCETDH